VRINLINFHGLQIYKNLAGIKFRGSRISKYFAEETFGNQTKNPKKTRKFLSLKYP